MEKSFGLIGAIAVIELGREQAPYWCFIVVGGCGLAAKLIHIWMEDKNGNSIPDIMESDEKS
jgi:hypothetical protein